MPWLGFTDPMQFVSHHGGTPTDSIANAMGVEVASFGSQAFKDTTPLTALTS